MATQGKVIKNKIRSVGNIRKITKTMEMVSVSKMRRAVERTQRSQAYTLQAYSVLAALVAERDVTHSLVQQPRDAQRRLVVIVASNKGMCGGYNVTLGKKLREDIAVNGACDVITIGKQAETIARRLGCTVVASFLEFSDLQLQVDEVRSLVQVMIQQFETGEYTNVSIVHTAFIKAMQYEARITPLLPLSIGLIGHLPELARSQDTPKVSGGLYAFEPSPERLVSVLIPKLLLALVYQIMLEAYASEHSSRMVAMKNATDNAGSLIDELVLTYNQARQAAVTQELAEIVGGANALHYS